MLCRAFCLSDHVFRRCNEGTVVWLADSLPGWLRTHSVIHRQWVPTLTQPGIKERTERDTETDTGVRLCIPADGLLLQTNVK